MSGFSNILIMSQVKILVLRGEAKLVPPRGCYKANRLSIRWIYFCLMRGDLLGSMGKQHARCITARRSLPARRGARSEFAQSLRSFAGSLSARRGGPCKTVVYQGVARLGEPLLRFVDPGLLKASFQRPGPQNETSIAFAMLTP